LAELCKSLRALKLGSAIFNKETRTVWYVLFKRINKEKEVFNFQAVGNSDLTTTTPGFYRKPWKTAYPVQDLRFRGTEQ
jgi:hypothetical protein